MSVYRNPFDPQSDQYQLWDMLFEQDIEAFIHSDWNRVKDDFIQEGFTAIDAKGSDNPDNWRLSFKTLQEYRDLWLQQSHEMVGKISADNLRQALIAATNLDHIEVDGSSALLHKKFDGQIVTNDGTVNPLHWQTIYQCVKINGRWKIGGFVGYLPNPMGASDTPVPAKQVPANADQHISAGPYSPVLIVTPSQMVVISGQVAVNAHGDVVGANLQEQTTVTLQNCQAQLASAGCSFKDVFKVNVYLPDLSKWDEFNQIYQTFIPEPRPVRTTVGAQLLPGFLIEIEMWAVKK